MRSGGSGDAPRRIRSASASWVGPPRARASEGRSMDQQPQYAPQQPPGQPGGYGQPMQGMTPAPMGGGGASVAHAITHGPSFAMLRVDLQPGQVVIAEAGSMVARHSHVAMEVKMNAGKSAG